MKEYDKINIMTDCVLVDMQAMLARYFCRGKIDMFFKLDMI